MSMLWTPVEMHGLMCVVHNQLVWAKIISLHAYLGIYSHRSWFMFYLFEFDDYTVLGTHTYISAMCMLLIVQSDVQCLGATPETIEVEISTNLDTILTVEECSFSNSTTTNTSCGKFTLEHGDGHITLSLNLSEYLQLNENYAGNIGVHNIAGSANTSVQICK